MTPEILHSLNKQASQRIPQQMPTIIKVKFAGETK